MSYHHPFRDAFLRLSFIWLNVLYVKAVQKTWSLFMYSFLFSQLILDLNRSLKMVLLLKYSARRGLNSFTSKRSLQSPIFMLAFPLILFTIQRLSKQFPQKCGERQFKKGPRKVGRKFLVGQAGCLFFDFLIPFFLGLGWVWCLCSNSQATGSQLSESSFSGLSTSDKTYSLKLSSLGVSISIIVSCSILSIRS